LDTLLLQAPTLLMHGPVASRFKVNFRAAFTGVKVQGIVGVGVLVRTTMQACSKRVRPWSTNRHVHVHAHAHGWLVLPRDPGRSWVAAGTAGPPLLGDVSKLASGSTWWGRGAVVTLVTVHTRVSGQTEAARGRPGRMQRPIDEVFGGFCRSFLVALVPYLIKFLL
jgi:hypothetical protein